MKVICCALVALLAGTCTSSAANPSDNTRNTSKSKAGKLGKSRDDGGGPLPICSVCGDDRDREVVEVDFLIVGSGPAGLSSSADLSKALRKIGSNQTVAVIEKNNYVGGRFFDVDLKTPEGYNGKLRGGHGALRMNPSTLPHLRRQMNEYGLQLYCSIFNNRITARGRSVECDLQNQCHIFGNFCSYNPIFVDQTNTDEMPYGAAFPLDMDILERTEGDPE